MAKKPRLTDLQLVLLSSAAQRPDGMLLPPSETIRARGKILERSLEKLLRLALIEECPAMAAEQAWRDEDDGNLIALRIATAGRGALGLGVERADLEDQAGLPPPGYVSSKDCLVAAASAEAATDRSRADGSRAVRAEPPIPPRGPSVRPGTKQASLVDNLSRPNGARIADLVALLGWQPHTIRAALTGLRKKGYRVASGKDDAGANVYRITAATMAIDDAA